LETAGRYLVDPLLTDALTASQNVLNLYVAFGEEALAAGVKRWNLIRKIHTFCHLTMDMEKDHLNCRFFLAGRMRR
jgi:hypothetical protein